MRRKFCRRTDFVGAIYLGPGSPPRNAYHSSAANLCTKKYESSIIPIPHYILVLNRDTETVAVAIPILVLFGQPSTRSSRSIALSSLKLWFTYFACKPPKVPVPRKSQSPLSPLNGHLT